MERHTLAGTPHWLRFARAVTLVSALGGAASGCCPMIPDVLACAHCSCPYGPTPNFSRPLSCETIGRADTCCYAYLPVPGPLAPPELSV